MTDSLTLTISKDLEAGNILGVINENINRDVSSSAGHAEPAAPAEAIRDILDLTPAYRAQVDAVEALIESQASDAEINAAKEKLQKEY